tara:strand:- start:633 stop:878 length:246 start_codon:yes stop_codon:yes gene_type:complete
MLINEWNYGSLGCLDVGCKVFLNYGNGMGSDRRFPYLVENIEYSKRGDNVVYVLEGRRILKNGQLKNNDWFKAYFTDKELV